MSTESLNRTSEILKTPSQVTEAPRRVNVDVLKQRLLVEKKKEKVKRTIISNNIKLIIKTQKVVLETNPSSNSCLYLYL